MVQCAGCPAAVVPGGSSPEGLPIGVQIVARPFEDEMALGIAASWTRLLAIGRRRWHGR